MGKVSQLAPYNIIIHTSHIYHTKTYSSHFLVLSYNAPQLYAHLKLKLSMSHAFLIRIPRHHLARMHSKDLPHLFFLLQTPRDGMRCWQVSWFHTLSVCAPNLTRRSQVWHTMHSLDLIRPYICTRSFVGSLHIFSPPHSPWHIITTRLCISGHLGPLGQTFSQAFPLYAYMRMGHATHLHLETPSPTSCYSLF